MSQKRNAEFLARCIDQAAGREPADVVVRDVQLLDLTSGAITACDIAICGDRIVGTHARYQGRQIIEGRGRFAVPGFIDTHLHIESSLVTPGEFDRMVLPHGVTAAIWDPHEIANVLGGAGIAWALAWAETSVMDIRVNLSSCVPATHLETSGARLDAADLTAFRSHPKVLGLAEFMNFPGVIHKDAGVLAKLAAFSDGHIDGHCPLLSGTDLNAYIAAGICTDHETTGPQEAHEKLAKGLTLLIREGSVSKDLHALAQVLTLETSPFCAFCTDDRNPLDIAEEGHLDHMIRTAIALGVPVLAAYRAATWSGAHAFGLSDRGLVAPGRRADIVLVDTLEGCCVSEVICAGRRVDDARFATRASVPAVGLGSVRRKPVVAADFATPGDASPAPVIGVIPGKIITEHLRLTLPVQHGQRCIDPMQDVIKIAVLERHGKTGGQACGFVHGFGLQRGAIGSSVGHDSHNLCIVGVDDGDMAAAANRLIAIGGGFVVVAGGEVRAELALPIAGLISDCDHETVRERLIALRLAARELGCVLAEPFLQVAFLPLPVIPHLKISDLGMVDVDRFRLIES